MKIQSYSAPVMVTWQLTRDCNLACLHCCTDSAPGRALPDELSRVEALHLADQLVEQGVPYVMIVGGEPTIVPHFFEVAQRLGRGGVFLKIETNGQNFSDEVARLLADLPIRSVQISLDGASQTVYAKMRPGGLLEKAVDACRAVRRDGMPLEVTFAPTGFNLDEAEAVIDLAASLGAFRLNSGRLMRVGTAAKLWDKLVPSEEQYDKFYRLLLRKEAEYAGKMELCFRPFSMAEEMGQRSEEPSGTMLILPDGRVKVSAALAYLCADLRKQTLAQAWDAYRSAWSHPRVVSALAALAQDESRLALANRWEDLQLEFAGSGHAGNKEQQ